MLKASPRDWKQLGKGERMFPQLSTYYILLLIASFAAVLRSPFEDNFTLDNATRRRLARYLQPFFSPNITKEEITALLPKQLLRAGKLRVLGEASSICGKWASLRRKGNDYRDLSFVRVSSHSLLEAIKLRSLYGLSFNYQFHPMKTAAL
jgi:hypothetical protein